MAKKKGDAASTPETAAATGATTDSKPPSKMDAVRTALKEGADKPEDGVAFIKERFGLDVDVKMFSVYKSKIKTEGGKGGRKRRGRKATGKAVTATAPVRASSSGGTVASPLDALKTLVRDFGKDGVKKLVDMI